MTGSIGLGIGRTRRRGGRPAGPVVLHVLGALRPSGMERMLMSGADAFRAVGVQRSIVVGQGDTHPYAAVLRGCGYDVEIFSRGIRREAMRFMDLVRSNHVDLIHIHTEADYLRTVLLAARALRGRGRIVRTVHSVFAATGAWRAKRAIQALLADRLVHAVIAPSPDVARNERRFFRRPHLIYNWVDGRFFEANRLSATERPERRALIVGNCSLVKNHDLALRAALDAGWEVYHLGDESGATEAESSLLDALDAAGLLIERGVHDPSLYMSRATTFLMPSVHEGMGVALAEAIVSGLPAVVADVPGLRWATRSPAVTALALDLDQWTQMLQSAAFQRRRPDAVPGTDFIDFSAARGASEYVALYRS